MLLGGTSQLCILFLPFRNRFGFPWQALEKLEQQLVAAQPEFLWLAEKWVSWRGTQCTGVAESFFSDILWLF